MSHKITFYPLGNAECSLLELSNGKKILFDYANTYSGDKDDLRIDLGAELGSISKFDVVMFTHAHQDHVQGASEFFYLDYAQKYQSDDRVKIKELWISSAFILDTDLDDEDAKIIRKEAQYRLKNKYGIRVFAEPNKLEAWLKRQSMSIDEVSDLIVHAGRTLDTSALGSDISVFVHAPFSADSEEIESKNDPSIVLQVALFDKNIETDILITGDVPHEVLDKIVDLTKLNDNESYLKWDIYDIPHHCSYTALGDEKGAYQTTPSENVKWLLPQGQKNAKMVASCKPIAEHADDGQPPHIQARRSYKYYTDSVDFYCTMEHPTKGDPKPLVFTIDQFGVTEKKSSFGVAHITSPAPRAG